MKNNEFNKLRRKDWSHGPEQNIRQKLKSHDNEDAITKVKKKRKKAKPYLLLSSAGGSVLGRYSSLKAAENALKSLRNTPWKSYQCACVEGIAWNKPITQEAWEKGQENG